MEPTSNISSEISKLFKQHAPTAGDWCDVVDGDNRDNKVSEIENPHLSEPSNCFSSKSKPIFVPANRDSERDHVPEGESNGFAVAVWCVPREATEEELFYYFGGDDKVITALKLHTDQPGEAVSGQVVFNSKEACDRAIQMNGKKFLGRTIRVTSSNISNNSVQPAPPVVSSYKRGYGSGSGRGQGQQKTRGRGPNTAGPGQFQEKRRHGRHQQEQTPMNMSSGNGPSVGQRRYGYAMNPSFGCNSSSMRRPMPNDAPAVHVRGPPPDAPTKEACDRAVATAPPAQKPDVFGAATPRDTAAKFAEIIKKQDEEKKLAKRNSHGGHQQQNHNDERENQQSLKIHTDQPSETVTEQVVLDSKEACERTLQTSEKKVLGRPIRVDSRKPNHNSVQPSPPVVSSYKNGRGSSSARGQGQQNTCRRGPHTTGSGQFQGKKSHGHQQQEQTFMNMSSGNGPSVGQQRCGPAMNPSFGCNSSPTRRQMPNDAPAVHVRGPPPDAATKEACDKAVATAPPAQKPDVFGAATPRDTAAKFAEIIKKQDEEKKLAKRNSHGGHQQHHKNGERKNQRSRNSSTRSSTCRTDPTTTANQ